MSRIKTNIAVLESSVIINEGLISLLSKFDSNVCFYNINDIEELNNCHLKYKIDIAIVNPLLLMNIKNEFLKFKRENNEIYYVAIVYSLSERALLEYYDEIIHITDNHDNIFAKLRSAREKNKELTNIREELTSREIDVLLQLLKGFSNKKIADKLNISVHTVISHRKNITEKTGIKSLPGLTIYAITQKLISLDS